MEERSVGAAAEDCLPGRRQVLRRVALGAAALAVAGCGEGAGQTRRHLQGSAASPTRPVTTSADTDLQLVRKAIVDEQALLAASTTVSRRFPALRAQLVPVLAQQRQHLTRLRATLTGVAPPRSRIPPQIAGSRDVAMAQLVERLADVRDARLSGCRDATAGPLAELLGSVAASHAQTTKVLAPRHPGVATGAVGHVDAVDPLQPCLAAEHAVIYGYGVLGGVVSAGVSDTPLSTLVRTSYDIHRSRRDALEALIREGRRHPVASAPAYELPFVVAQAGDARRLARYLELRCANSYAFALTALPRGQRQLISTAFIDGAVRGVDWGAAPVAFPGLAA